MAKRFYVCPMVRVFEDAGDIDGKLEPLVFKYLRGGHPGNANVAAIGEEGTSTAWALVKIDFNNSQDHVPVVQDVDVDDIPDISVDDTLPVEARNKVADIFTKRQVPGPVRASDSLRDLLGRIARQAKPGFIQDEWF